LQTIPVISPSCGLSQSHYISHWLSYKQLSKCNCNQQQKGAMCCSCGLYRP